MQIQERLIVPGLGVVILLSVFMLNVPIVYKVLLAILGLAAAGTYFVPNAVQVETRIAIAAVGLIILLLISSTAFWLTLLSFAAIAALQIPHRHTLQRSPATITWLNAVLKQRSGAPDGEGVGEGAGAVAAAGDGQSAQATAPFGIGALPAFVRMNIAGVGSSILGVLVVVSVFIPWVIFVVTIGDESESMGYTLRSAAETLESNASRTFFILLLVLGILSIPSIVLPRVVPAIIAVVGLIVTIVSYAYLFGEFEDAFLNSLGGQAPSGIGAGTFPHIGILLAAFCFLVIFVLQLIPGLNITRGKVKRLSQNTL